MLVLEFGFWLHKMGQPDEGKVYARCLLRVSRNPATITAYIPVGRPVVGGIASLPKRVDHTFGLESLANHKRTK